ncbi:DEAD/DEAH box helicase family protein [Oerskovia paurometabola]|uniref:DEAD/DEAH box helicase family protein n=1 Tax=Oerskovia paurometabola TaxID=162170 RepID=A0ABW1X6P1_9CELL|nr:DEAD/DEAH box helicase family protein [Oerskovia paurometabola]MBM7495719.1 superfamily II DNA or RNA helicase [Oerskovia paurometabola]
MGLRFVDPGFLRAGGPLGFTRQVERLLALIGFVDVINIDASGDQGGDLIGRLKGDDWVFQAKWRLRGGATVDADAVDEVQNAMSAYRIDRGVVVTNGTFTKKARARVEALRKVNLNISLWDGVALEKLHDRASERTKPFKLHEYQERAVEGAWKALTDTGRALTFLATGLGKTVVAGRVVTKILTACPGARVLVVAHTTDLVEQLERSMWRDIPKSVATRVVNGTFKPDDLRGVTFAVLPTAANYVRSGFKPDAIIVDEAHHVGEDGDYADVFAALPDVPRLGVTATPWRGDRFDIEKVFGRPVVRVSISDGMCLGYLASVRYKLYSDNIDWDFVRDQSEKGYSIRDLNKRLFVPERDEAIRDHLIEVWGRTRSPRAIVFCQTILHAEEMAGLLARVPGWTATTSIHGQLTKSERRDRLVRFRNGEIPILTSVDLLNEGVDVPDVNILAFARVTHSRRIFVQQLGRGLRIRAGKESVEVLDFVSDIRRLAEIHDLREQVSESEAESVSVPRNEFEFTDARVEGLLERWIADVGDLAGADDSVRLEFPPEVGA